MCKFIIVLIFLAIIFITADCAFFKNNERVSANIEYSKSCGTEEDNKLKSHFSSRKYNRTHTGISFNFTLYELLDKRYTLDVELRIWGDGGWKHNFFHYKREDPCNTLHLLLGKTWIGMLDALDANHGCPIKAGFYHFEDYFIDVSKIPFLAMAGKFHMIIRITKGSVPQACCETVLVVTAEVLY